MHKTKQRMSARRMGIMSRVLVRFASGEIEEFTIVHSRDTDPRRGMISCDSPLGKALMDKTKGDTAEYGVNDCIFHVEIVEIFTKTII